MRGTPLRHNVAVQRRYLEGIDKLIDLIIEETEKEVKKLYLTKASKLYFAEDSVAMDASIASSARINMNALIKELSKIISKKANFLSEVMVGGVDQAGKSNLHRSLKELSGGLSIKTNINSGDIQEAFTASVNANADLIKSVSSNYLNQVKGAVNRSIQNGGGLQDLIPSIEKVLRGEARKVRNKAKNVALDQTRKAYNSLNAARMKKVGLQKFEWVHSGGGQTPRPYHQAKFPAGLNGGIFSLDDLPVIDKKTGETGLPGQAINCKCFMRPIVEFNEGEQVVS